MNKYRTHNCSDLSEKDIEKKVSISGWLHRKRDHGNLLFIDLRDHYGITQCVIENNSEYFTILEKTKPESVLKVTGKDPKMFAVAAKAIKISMRSSLETVGVSTRGIKGNIKIKGLAVVFLFGMRTWSKEEGRDITATTRILDDRLKWAESLATSLGMVEEKSGHDL